MKHREVIFRFVLACCVWLFSGWNHASAMPLTGCLFANSNAYALAANVTVSDFLANPVDMICTVRKQVDYLDANMAALKKGDISATTQFKVDYMRVLASKLLYSFTGLVDDPAMLTAPQSDYTDYHNTLKRLQEVLIRLLELPDIYIDVSVPVSFWNDVNLQGQSSFYHFSRIAYGLLHRDALSASVDNGTLFQWIENAIDREQAIGMAEKRALYNALANEMENYLAYEFARTPNVPDQNVLASTIQSDARNVVRMSRAMLHSFVTGGPGGAQDIAADWLTQAAKLAPKDPVFLAGKLRRVTASAVTNGLGAAVATWSAVSFTWDYANYLNGVEASLAHSLRAATFRYQFDKPRDLYVRFQARVASSRGEGKSIWGFGRVA